MFRYQRAVGGLLLVSYTLAISMASVLHNHGHDATAGGKGLHAHASGHECCHDHDGGHSHIGAEADSCSPVAQSASDPSLSASHGECSICRFLGQRVLAAQAGEDSAEAPFVQYSAIQPAPHVSFDRPSGYSSRAPPQIG